MISEPTEGSRPLFPGLPLELTTELGRAFSQAVDSLDPLRISLRRYVRSQRAGGATLSEIDAQLRRIILLADTRTDPDSVAASRELTEHIAKWTRAFFTGKAN